LLGSLSEAQGKQYQETGQVGPVPVLSAEEVIYFRSKMEAAEAALGDPLSRVPGQFRAKTHLLYTWMDELVRHPGILDAIESLIGSDILLYHLTYWIKEPGDGSFVSWHQDGTYFNLTPAEHVTAWVALSDATLESGCMRMLPGSHRAGQQDHEQGPIVVNLLSNGQQVALDIDESKAIDIIVPIGSVSFHHTHIVHSSGPNKSDDRRIGIGISYIPTRARFIGERRVSAALVRGGDEYGHFDPEKRPNADLDEAARTFHKTACDRFFVSHGSKLTESSPA
jgi:chlorinating enzyme